MDIVQLAPGPPVNQGQWRLAACQEDDVQRGGQMIDKKGQHVVDTRLCDDVIVVENEQSAAEMVRDVIEQKRQHHFLRRQLKEWLKRGEEQSKGAASEIGVKALTGRDDRAPETRRIVISFIQCHPRPCAGRNQWLGGKELQQASATRSRHGVYGAGPTTG